MHDLAVALDHALHSQQPRAEQLAALPLDQTIPHHHVDAARFVLERDENHTARGVGTLPAGDQPGNTRAAAVGAQAKFSRGEESKFVQTASQQRERVAAESQPEAGVVGDDVLAFARRLEPRQALGRWRIERLPGREPPREGENIIADYASLALTLGPHPLAL